MGKTGSFSMKDFKNLQQQLNKIQPNQVGIFIDSCAKELAARLLAEVIKRTPVGDYSKEVTVVAKRESKYHEEAVSGSGKGDAKAYADSLKVNHFGNATVIEIVNPVEYAPYVEFGHRTRNLKGWVEGRFMLTFSEQKIQDMAPRVLERKIKQFLEGCMG